MKQVDCTCSECNFLRLFMYEFKCESFVFSPEIFVRHKCLVFCLCVHITNMLVLNAEVKNVMYMNSVAMELINHCWLSTMYIYRNKHL